MPRRAKAIVMLISSNGATSLRFRSVQRAAFGPFAERFGGLSYVSAERASDSVMAVTISEISPCFRLSRMPMSAAEHIRLVKGAGPREAMGAGLGPLPHARSRVSMVIWARGSRGNLSRVRADPGGFDARVGARQPLRLPSMQDPVKFRAAGSRRKRVGVERSLPAPVDRDST